MKISGTRARRAYLAKISNGEIQYVYEFQFNPTEDEKAREVEWGWAAAQGTALPEAVFTRIASEKFTMQLFLDATENYSADKEGVRADIAALESFTFPDPDMYSADMGQVASPPPALFGIGEDVYNIVVESTNVRVVRRNFEMHPTRAFVDIKLSSTFTDVKKIQESIMRNSELARKVLIARRA